MGSKKDIKKRGIEQRKKKRDKAGARENQTKQVVVDVLVYYEGRTFWEERWVSVAEKDLHWLEDLYQRDEVEEADYPYGPDDDDFYIGQDEDYIDAMNDRDIEASALDGAIYLKTVKGRKMAVTNSYAVDYKQSTPFNDRVKYGFTLRSPKTACPPKVDDILIELGKNLDDVIQANTFKPFKNVTLRLDQFYEMPREVFEQLMEFQAKFVRPDNMTEIESIYVEDPLTRGDRMSAAQVVAGFVKAWNDVAHGRATVWDVSRNFSSQYRELERQISPKKLLYYSEYRKATGFYVFDVDQEKEMAVLSNAVKAQWNEWWRYGQTKVRIQNLQLEINNALKSLVKALYVIRNPLVYDGDVFDYATLLAKYIRALNKFDSDNRGSKYNLDFKQIELETDKVIGETALVALNGITFSAPKPHSKNFDEIGKLRGYNQSYARLNPHITILRGDPDFEWLRNLHMPVEIKDLTVDEAFKNNFDKFEPAIRPGFFYEQFLEICQEMLDKHGNIEDPAEHLRSEKVLKIRAAITATAFDNQASSGAMYAKLAVNKGGMMEKFPRTVIQGVLALLRLITSVDLESLPDPEYIDLLGTGIIHPYKFTVKEEFMSNKKFDERRPRGILVAPFNNLIATQMVIGEFLEKMKHDVSTSGIAIGYGHTTEMLREVVGIFEGVGKTVSDDIEGMERSIYDECYTKFYQMPLLMMESPDKATMLAVKNLCYMSKRKYVEVDCKLLLQKREKQGHTVSGGLETTCLNSVVRNAAGRAIGDKIVRNTSDDGISVPKEILDGFEEDRKARFKDIGFKVKEIEIHEGLVHYCSAVVNTDGTFRWKSCRKSFANLMQSHTPAKAREFVEMYETALDYHPSIGEKALNPDG